MDSESRAWIVDHVSGQWIASLGSGSCIKCTRRVGTLLGQGSVGLF